MTRTTKTVYLDSKGGELISIKNGKPYIECTYSTLDAERLMELSRAASAAAEEILALAKTPEEVAVA